MLSTLQLRDVMTQAGIPDAKGFPVRSVFAATARSESNGMSIDAATGGPLLGDTALPSGPSIGLLQIERGSHPSIYVRVANIIANPALTETQKAVAQVRASKTIIEEALMTALRGLRILADRGVGSPSMEAIGALIDAAWQHSPADVLTWATNTRTGDVREINPRYARFIEHFRELETPSAFTDGFLLLFGVFGALGFVLWAVSQMEDS